MPPGHDPKWLQQQFPYLSSPTPLGEGGQKFVYAGRHPTDADVVLKLFHPNSDLARAQREILAVKNVASPRVPRIFDVGVVRYGSDDLLWVREQRVTGRTLRGALAGGQLPDDQVLVVGHHILEALAAAERCRIVHRDVKPENIIVDGREAYLLDFGIARHLELDSLTSTAAVFGIGTLGYSPAEQFRNRKVEIDNRSDLFALGVTLYESIEGQNPFLNGARDALDVLHRVETQALPAVTRDIDGQGQLCQMVLAMTRTRRDHRIPTAAEALAWIESIIAARRSP